MHPMTQNVTGTAGFESAPSVRKPWQAPRVEELPRLTELTLGSGAAIEGECLIGGGGSTCF